VALGRFEADGFGQNKGGSVAVGFDFAQAGVPGFVARVGVEAVQVGT